jgi:hydrogenase maturation protein HypF
LRRVHPAEAIVLSGGVFQNWLLLELLRDRLLDVPVWTPIRLPPNDAGLAIGQIALTSHAPLPSTAARA